MQVGPWTVETRSSRPGPVRLNEPEALGVQTLEPQEPPTTLEVPESKSLFARPGRVLPVHTEGTPVGHEPVGHSWSPVGRPGGAPSFPTPSRFAFAM